jgi:YfiH family protein
MSWDSGSVSEVAERRAEYFSTLDLNISSAVSADQVHGTFVHNVQAEDCGRGMLTPTDRIPACDGFLCTQPGVILTTLHADCAPLFIVDVETRVMGLAHCGWRGTLAGLPGILLSRFLDLSGGNSKSIRACIGPAISTGCYEFGEHEAAQFGERFGSTVIARLGGRPHVDLVAAIIINLLENGLNSSTIPPRPPCTFKHGEHASFRRDGSPTRCMMAWLVRTE